MSAPALTVVLPALDEAPGLRVLLPRLKAVFERLGVAGEILVVDGGSRDGTADVAREGGARVLRQAGKGFGSAVREGLAAAAAEHVVLMDADGSHAPEDIERFWARRGDAELIVGSRYCRGGSADMPLTRHLLSRPLNAVTRRVLDLPVRESSSGFRLYRAASARAVPSRATDFSVQQDLMVGILSRGGRVIELPIHYSPRAAGRSKANAWKLLPAYASLLWRLKAQRGGWRSEAGLAAALALALAAGLRGITGGLPGPERLRALPEAARSSPEFAPRLAEAWRALYREIERSHEELRADEPRTSVQGVVRVPAGWSFPPGPLLNSARSLLTQSINPDEKKSFIILSRMRPWRLEFEPLYVQYGGAFVYPLGAFLGAAHLAGLARLTPDLAYYLSRPEAMARLYLLGRVYVLLFHLGTVWLLFELGRVLSGRRTGTAAAVLWALTPLAVAGSHVLKPHPVAAFWAAAAAYCAVRAQEEGRGADYLLCGAAAGLAAGGNLTLVYLLALPVLARALRREGGWGASLGGAAAGGALVAAANPYLLLAPGRFAWELTVYSPSTFAAPWGPLISLARLAPQGLGVGAASLAAAGLAAGLAAGGPRRLLAATVLGGAALIASRFHYLSDVPSSLRLHYASAALAVLLGADFARFLPPAGRALVLAVVVAETAWRGSVYLSDLGREAGPASTRAAAADWIDENVPEGARVGLVRYPEPPHTPPFRWDRVELTVYEDPAAASGDPPEWFVGSAEQLRAVERALPNRYDTARAFLSARRGGLRAADDSFFANTDMLILRRRDRRP